MQFTVVLAIFTSLLSAQKPPATIYKDSISAVVAITGASKMGSGFIIAPDGVVVTNLHVVSGEHRVSVRLAGGLELSTDEVLAADPALDIALLRLQTAWKLPSLPLGDSDRVSPGDSVVVISNPLGLEGSVTNGLVSGLRNIGGKTVLQISAPISRGSSGGPVFDRDGAVIAVARSTVIGGQNVNLAVPVNSIKRLLETPRRSKLSGLAGAYLQGSSAGNWWAPVWRHAYRITRTSNGWSFTNTDRSHRQLDVSLEGAPGSIMEGRGYQSWGERSWGCTYEVKVRLEPSECGTSMLVSISQNDNGYPKSEWVSNEGRGRTAQEIAVMKDACITGPKIVSGSFDTFSMTRQ